MNQVQAHRRRGGKRRWWPISLVGLLAVGSEPTSGQQPRGGPAPVSLDDPRLAPLRAAAARWEARRGPDRAVVDQVCLVPDVPTFLAAIGHWDRGRYFPVLIEEAESTLRFLRAFRPARVVRYPGTAPAPAAGRSWEAALAAVAASWREPSPSPGPGPGATPPGVVVSHPDAPMLAAAVALAAGRFQPLARLDPPRTYRGALTPDEFRRFDADLTAAVARVAPSYRGLGDDCDFLTVAGDYPYRYRDAGGQDEAVDDGVARTEAGGRWAYTGRILGDPAASVARAMAALFLQPEAATLFNGYDDRDRPWSDYATVGAALRLSGGMSIAARHAAERDGGVASWHEAFDPENRAGLVWINSHGSPTVFHLQGDEPASTTDVPRTVPAAVVMIHSFSAADPTDADTIAGRWLANGAFIYFGSINEPYLQAFRTPQFAADLLAERLPLAAVLRNTSVEPFGAPWRLVYLGDPLFRIEARPPGGKPPRAEPGPSTRDWPVVAAPGFAPTPGSAPLEVAPEATLQAGYDAALALVGAPQATPDDPAVAATIAVLGGLDRDRLCPESRRLHDAVLADLLFHARRRGELRARIESIAPPDRSPALGRWLDALRSIDFAWVLAGDDFTRTVAAWSRLVRSDALVDFRRQATARVAAHATDPERRAEWVAALRLARADPRLPPGTDFLGDELRRAEAALGGDPTRPGAGRRAGDGPG